ncbi:PREDICTED: polypeptide N-acetylgalactosaminyltransferase 9-like [Chlamydotis macqueenii]|uniref:polypeptide N-acetylgalactosaminyltransferase 9-like n=1 Tax=Chlamydotis macqueenii TaxID=187382 RepID=UPI000529B127|nr:PREDICTED: polypeptide N-acetylgalactosaminyltransferase 9-like [Chlamydotis macqueenii]
MVGSGGVEAGNIASYERPCVGETSFPGFALEQYVPDREGPNTQQDRGLLTSTWARSQQGKRLQIGFLVRYSSEGVLQLGPLGSTAFLPDSKCLIDDGKGRTPTLKKCEDVLRPAQRFWDFTQNGPIISRDTGRCLEVEMSKDANFGLRLVVQRCSGQKWMIRNWIKHGRH